MILIICIYFALKQLELKISLIYIAILLIILSPSFPTAFLRLFVPEKLESVFFAIFICSYIFYFKKQSTLILIIAIISANIALYFKETSFILLGSMALFHFIFTIKLKNKKQKIIDILLMLSAFIWLILYYFIVIINKTTDYKYGDTPYNQLIVLIKTITNYLLNEPFLFIGISFLLIFRIYLIIKKKDNINPLLDSMLIASFMHLLSYIALNIWSFHYLLPAYIFAIFPIIFYFKKYITNKLVKFIFYICIFIYIFNSIPAFIYQFNHYKTIPTNFQNTLTFINNYLKESPNTNIYLYKVDSASNIEVYHSFIKYLEFMGNNNFDLFTDMPINDELLDIKNKDAKYNVFKTNELTNPKQNDLIVLTPYSSINVDSKQIQDYELLFESKFGFNIPLLNIKTLLKYFIHLIAPNIFLQKNIFISDVNFKIYRVK